MHKIYKRNLIIFSFIALLFSTQAYSSSGLKVKSSDYNLTVEPLLENLKHPWGMAFLPNSEILITERNGVIKKFDPSSGDLVIIEDGLPNNLATTGQGGLLDIAIHPDFSNNGYIYLTYAAQDSNNLHGTELLKAKLVDNRLVDGKVIFKAVPKTESTVHYGSRLLFDKDGKLFITLGEKYEMVEAQNLLSHLGSVIRLNDDGTVPQDNPFVNNKDALPEIYSYGHRNAQGIALNPIDGRVYEGEHGPKGGDEINILKAGANYGWPVITYGRDYDGSTISRLTRKAGMEQPLIYWVPSIAPAGMDFYRGDKFPLWQNDLFVAALAGKQVRRIKINKDKVLFQEKLFEKLGERIRDVKTGPDGYLYLLTDSENGKLLKIK